MNVETTIYWKGKKRTVLERRLIRGRAYLLLEKVGCSGRDKYFALAPHAGPGGDACMVHRLQLDENHRHYLQVLSRVCAGNRNLLNILDYQWRGDSVDLVTTWISGESLELRLARASRNPRLWPSPVMAFHLYRKLAHGLHQLSHREKIVHGDIKPANLILDHNNLVIADFGSAWKMKNAFLHLTGDGHSEEYAAPEQHLGLPHTDFRSDMFAATVVFYRMLTRTFPYAGYVGKAGLPEFRETMEPTLRAPKDVCPFRARLPRFFWEKVDAVVAKGLALDPDARFGTTREWVHRLNEIDAELKLCDRDGLLISAAKRVVTWFFPGPGSLRESVPDSEPE